MMSVDEARDTDDFWEALRAIAVARASAYAVNLSAEAAFSHFVAAKVHGIPLRPSRMLDFDVHVVLSRREDRPRASGVKAHFTPRSLRSVVIVDGLRVTDPVQTWVDLAPMVALAELVAIGDHLVKRREPDATLEQLDRAVVRAAGRHGVKRLRRALELVRPRTDSVRETEVRLILLDGGLPEPVVNAPLRDRNRLFIRHGDMVYERFRVLVEYDGEQHRLDDEQYRLDSRQRERLVAAGWLIVHVVKADLRHPADVVRRVREALRARGWH